MWLEAEGGKHRIYHDIRRMELTRTWKSANCDKIPKVDKLLPSLSGQLLVPGPLAFEMLVVHIIQKGRELLQQELAFTANKALLSVRDVSLVLILCEPFLAVDCNAKVGLHEIVQSINVLLGVTMFLAGMPIKVSGHTQQYV